MTWILIAPALDLPGQFVAHHLDRDVARQGSSPSHALQVCQEALGGVDGASSAPREYYKTLESVIELGKATTLAEVHDVWAVGSRDPETILGLDLKDHPGLVVTTLSRDPDLP